MSAEGRLESFAIAIPSLNQARYLSACLGSLGSKYPIDAFVADGGSTDATVKILERFQERVSWVSEPDGGQAAAINKAFSRVQGTIMCYMNSDDAYLPGALDCVGDRFSAGSAEIVLGWALNLSAGERVSSIWGPSRETLRDVEHLPVVFEPSAFWRREVWERFGPFRTDLRYVFGWEFLVQAIPHCEVSVIEQPLAINRLHDMRKTSVGGARRADEIVRLVERHGRPASRDVYRRVQNSSKRRWELLLDHCPARLQPLAYRATFPRLARSVPFHQAKAIYTNLRGH